MSACLGALLSCSISSPGSADAPHSGTVRSGRLTITYTTPADYLRLLGEAAFKSTKDPAFKPPPEQSGKVVVWEPAPSKMLAALGLHLPEKGSIAYIPSISALRVDADPGWHQALRRLHERIGIQLVPSRSLAR